MGDAKEAIQLEHNVAQHCSAITKVGMAEAVERQHAV